MMDDTTMDTPLDATTPAGASTQIDDADNPSSLSRSQSTSPPAAVSSTPTGGSGVGGIYDFLLTAVGLGPRAASGSFDDASEEADEEVAWSAVDNGNQETGDGPLRDHPPQQPRQGDALLSEPESNLQHTRETHVEAETADGREAARGAVPGTSQPLPDGNPCDEPSGASGRTAHSTSETTTAATTVRPHFEAGVSTGTFPSNGNAPAIQGGGSNLPPASEHRAVPGVQGSGEQGADQGAGSAASHSGVPRRRRRLFGGGTAVSGSADSANNGDGAPNPQPPPASRIASLGNPLFRSMERGGSFWQGRLNSSSSATPATGRRGRSFSRNRDRPNGATDAGTRAVERAVNGDSSSRTSRGVTNAAAAGRGGGNATNSADASESGRGVGGGGDGDASEEGQILFYHKPTLANVPAGDVPDVVPVYLGCPRGGMALGLPLNDAWQGGEQQETTFNQNYSYTILSWPENHLVDMLELWRLQVLFLTTMIFNVLVAALLFFAENPDRTRVEGPSRPGSYPAPFERRSPEDQPDGLRSEGWHLAAAMIIGLLGIICVLGRVRAGIAVYLVLATVNAIVGLSHSPDALFACRYAVDLVLVAMGRSYLSSLTYSWVTASAGDSRRGR